jgi:GNAT superfamily N-acetyltransferase
MQIRQASSRADIELVAPLFDRYRVFYEQPANLEGSRDFLFERWRARESVLFFALAASGACAGFVHLYPLFSSIRMSRLWLLNDLFVDDAARRTGVGRRLMQRAERHAAETEARGLILTTALTNLTAQALYESEGYVRDAVFAHYGKKLPSR